MNGEAERLRERLLQLEEHSAHCDRTIGELSAQIAEQWTIIDHLQLRLEQLTEQFRALEDSALEAPAITRPPHY